MCKPLRIGILGTSQIARLAILRAARAVPGVEVVAVASRTSARASKVAKEYGLAHSYGSYEELIESPLVSAVYICCANGLHVAWCKQALAAGKHVLVEKPLSLDAEGFRQVEGQRSDIPTAIQGLTVLEAIMIQHHPWQSEVKQWIDNGELGALTGCRTEICFPIAEKRLVTMRNASRGGGVTCDVTPYWLQILQATIGTFTPPCVHRVERYGELDVEVELETISGTRVPSHLLASFRRDYKATNCWEFDGGVIEILDLFRPNIGDRLFQIVVSRYGAKEPERINFAPQNYFKNQLSAFLHYCQHGGGDALLMASGQRAASLGDLRAQLLVR